MICTPSLLLLSPPRVTDRGVRLLSGPREGWRTGPDAARQSTQHTWTSGPESLHNKQLERKREIVSTESEETPDHPVAPFLS